MTATAPTRHGSMPPRTIARIVSGWPGFDSGCYPFPLMHLMIGAACCASWATDGTPRRSHDRVIGAVHVVHPALGLGSAVDRLVRAILGLLHPDAGREKVLARHCTQRGHHRVHGVKPGGQRLRSGRDRHGTCLLVVVGIGNGGGLFIVPNTVLAGIRLHRRHLVTRSGCRTR